MDIHKSNTKITSCISDPPAWANDWSIDIFDDGNFQALLTRIRRGEYTRIFVEPECNALMFLVQHHNNQSATQGSMQYNMPLTDSKTLADASREHELLERACSIIETAALHNIPYAIIVPSALPRATNDERNTPWHFTFAKRLGAHTATFQPPPSYCYPEDSRLTIVYDAPQARHFSPVRELPETMRPDATWTCRTRYNDKSTACILRDAIDSFLNDIQANIPPINAPDWQPTKGSNIPPSPIPKNITYGTNPIALVPTRDGREDLVRVEQLIIPTTPYDTTRASPRYTLTQYIDGYYRILYEQQSYTTKGVQHLMPNHEPSMLNTTRAPTPHSVMLSIQLDQARCAYPVDTLCPTDITRYRAILEFLENLTRNSRPDLAYTTAMLYQAWDNPTLPLLRSAEHALIYLWQTRTLALSCPVSCSTSNGTTLYLSNLLHAKIVIPNNDKPNPEVTSIRRKSFVFEVPNNTSTAIGANTTSGTTTSPSDPAKSTTPSTLLTQLQPFAGIDDFLTKPLEVTRFTYFREQAMGHKHSTRKP